MRARLKELGITEADVADAVSGLGAPGVSGLRVVLDTIVVVSALLFERPTLRELMWVLAYPKFHLSAVELGQLLADLLPWREIWSTPTPPRADSKSVPGSLAGAVSMG